MMGDKNRLPDYLNKEKLIRLFDAIDRPKVAIASFLSFFCGLRISEVCNLKIENIDLERKKLKVVDSKGAMRSRTGYGKDRYIPIPQKCISPIEKWLEIIGSDSKWFLPSMSSPDRPIRKKSLYEQFHIALEKAELAIPDYEFSESKGKFKGRKKTKYKYYFHTLRHSYATYLLEKGVDIMTISTLLGHNQVTTTQIYTRVSQTQRQKAVEDAFGTPLQEFKSSTQQGLLGVLPRSTSTRTESSDPIEILRLRLAKGELPMEAYRQMMNELTGQKADYFG